VKVSELIKIIENDGWYLSRTKGSHRQYKHSIKKGVVTISGKLSSDIAMGTLKSVIKQAGLK
jgi:predicted RNA binding protein YcfA (HicA-like mRNA interferase family)